jgi:hypothetical protein
MTVVNAGRERRSRGESRALILAVLVLFLVVGIGLLPLTGRTISFGSRGWINLRVDPGAGPGRGVEFTHTNNAYNIPGATFYEFRVGSWYWAAFVAKSLSGKCQSG